MSMHVQILEFPPCDFMLNDWISPLMKETRSYFWSQPILSFFPHKQHSTVLHSAAVIEEKVEDMSLCLWLALWGFGLSPKTFCINVFSWRKWWPFTLEWAARHSTRHLPQRVQQYSPKGYSPMLSACNYTDTCCIMMTLWADISWMKWMLSCQEVK